MGSIITHYIETTYKQVDRENYLDTIKRAWAAGFQNYDSEKNFSRIQTTFLSNKPAISILILHTSERQQEAEKLKR